jgi:hypothetical protein
VARYRTKDEVDLAWNRIRRHITEGIDSRIRDVREVLLNEALSDAWDNYTKAIETGTVIQLEEDATRWVEAIIEPQLAPVVEAIGGADLDES